MLRSVCPSDFYIMSELQKLKGIGPKIEKHLNNLGIFTKEDLLYYFPRDYEEYNAPIHISDINGENIYTFYAVVASKPSFFRKGRVSITSTWIDDGSAKIRVYWFNAPFMNKNITLGEAYYFRGKVNRVKNGIALSQPKVFKKEVYEGFKGKLNPIYPLTKGLNNATIRKTIAEVLLNAKIDEYLPKKIIDERKLIDISYAINHIHLPKDYDDMIKSRNRLVYDEFFIFSLAMLLNKNKTKRVGRKELRDIDEKDIKDIKSTLSYTLTSDQEKTISEIVSDFKTGKKMNRLIEGDVGSGKTIVSFVAALLTAKAGLQAAIMAPTEILSEQHYKNLISIIKKSKIFSNINVAYLIGSTKAKDRSKILKELKNGEINILVGTHALFSSDVEYNDLGLVVIDEQHRFGVAQRKALEEKSKNANTLVMSATPIPRTLAMLLYADLDISYIKEKPKDRLSIKNCVIDAKDREKGYKAIEKELSLGHQAYVICPSIEKADEDEVGNFANYQNVTEYAKILKEYFGKNVNIEILHGKMKADKKEKIMKDFKDGIIDILVSTTVVEVGVDVPNATFIMVEDAGSFGLAELHQLRGRVGRGDAQSYALFVNTDKSDKAKERLNVLNNSNDGFFIAEEDLRLRGPGDIFGAKQSGEMDFKLADMYTDIKIFREAGVDAKEFIDKGYKIEGDLKDKLNNYLKNGYII